MITGACNLAFRFLVVSGTDDRGVASLGGAALVWTGISLALRRFWAWRKRAARGGVESADQIAA